jgi:hypothetical protein
MLNNARILIECCCQLTHRKSGITSLYVLGASCKTEQVGVMHDIWTQPNAVFPYRLETRVFNPQILITEQSRRYVSSPFSGTTAGATSGLCL